MPKCANKHCHNPVRQGLYRCELCTTRLLDRLDLERGQAYRDRLSRAGRIVDAANIVLESDYPSVG